MFECQGSGRIDDFSRGQLAHQLQPVEKPLTGTEAYGPDQVVVGQCIAIADKAAGRAMDRVVFVLADLPASVTKRSG